MVAAERKTADQRREEILVAAFDEFAEHGLHGTSTDVIARKAGVSQPYVFRLFGTKKELYLESVLTKTSWTFAITSVALFMTTLDNLVVTTALPVIRKDLNADLSGLEWTVNAYTLTFAVLLITGAAPGDRFGRRRMFVIGLGI